jgi:Skp family chaperone for outer membrane proteins
LAGTTEGDEGEIRGIADTGSVRASAPRAVIYGRKRRSHDPNLSQLIDKLAGATETSASELAAAVRQITQDMPLSASEETASSNAQIQAMVSDLREETVQRQDAFERRAEERDRQILQILDQLT